MKKFILTLGCLGLLSLTSCKKDRVCVCTNTYTDASGATTTALDKSTTYEKMKKSDAKNLCQRSTHVSVDSNGGTSTSINDCKLK